jgi:hypothetical protein
MNNFQKKIWIITLLAVAGFLMTGLTACKDKEEGGTIAVKYVKYVDGRNIAWTFCIKDTGYNHVTGAVLMNPGDTRNFTVNDDGYYWVCYNHDISGDCSPIKNVSVSGGETVNVTIDFN